MAPREKYNTNNVLTRLGANDNNISKTSRELGIGRQCIKRCVAQECKFVVIHKKI